MIKINMDIPKCCSECIFSQHEEGCLIKDILFGYEDSVWVKKQRPNWCPLEDDIEENYLGKYNKTLEMLSKLDGVMEWMCDEMNEKDDWCFEHCKWDSPTKECIDRYIRYYADNLQRSEEV